jgi:hypothetical protein
MRLAIAASVQSGRALRVAKSATAFAKIVICLTNSQTLGELDKKGRSMSVHLDRSHPLAVSHMLKRATTRIGRVYIVVRRNVQVPRSLRSNLQRGLSSSNFDSKMPLLDSIRLL